jgi:hypothetical protein
VTYKIRVKKLEFLPILSDIKLSDNIAKRSFDMNTKKHPGDYPQLAIRISAEDKDRIQGLVEDLLSTANKKRPANEKVFRKNDIFVDALYLGLLTMKKKGYRLAKF